MKRICGRIARFLASLVLVGSLSLGTPPVPNPYYEFHVAGKLERPAGGSRQNISIFLFGKLRILNTGYRRLQHASVFNEADHPTGLTDSLGAFTLQASSDFPAESLRLAAVSPDSSLILGDPFFVNDSLAIPKKGQYTATDYQGCRSCSTEPHTVELIVAYRYLFENISITVSF